VGSLSVDRFSQEFDYKVTLTLVKQKLMNQRPLSCWPDLCDFERAKRLDHGCDGAIQRHGDLHARRPRMPPAA